MARDHQGYGQTCQSMGLVSRALADDSKGLIAFENAAKKQRSFLSEDYPRLPSTYCQLSLLHLHRMQYQLAHNYLQQTLDIQLSKLPLYHSQMKFSKELLREHQ